MLRRLVAGVLICLCSLELQAQYTLSAQKIAANTWVVEGSTDNFSPQNGGNIVNVGFIETPVGVVVIDTGPSFYMGKRFGKRLPRSVINRSLRFCLPIITQTTFWAIKPLVIFLLRP